MWRWERGGGEGGRGEEMGMRGEAGTACGFW